MMKENDLAKLFRRNKYTVKISSYSFELLITFLQVSIKSLLDRIDKLIRVQCVPTQQSNYMLIIAIINQYIDLKTFSGHPTSLVEEEYRAITGMT